MRVNLKKRLQQKQTGQALVEFAIIAIVLLLLFFVVIEMGRVLWAWISVQSAARAGARYASTGQFEAACLSDNPPCTDPRVASIQDIVYEGLAGLPLNKKPGRTYEDDFAVFVEIYGINDFGELQDNFAGIPGQPMAVRVVYNVPIITPILGGIVENVPVYGQVIQNNELFGQTGAITVGQSVAPAIPPIPTAGPSPTPTNSPTPTSTATATPGPSPTPTKTATPTNTPTPIRCNIQIEGNLVDGGLFIPVTGDLNTTIEIFDISAGGQKIGTANMAGPFDGHACEGFVNVPLTSPLVQGRVIAAQSSDGSFAVTTVLQGTPTNTPRPTNTPIPTNTPTPTPSTTFTPTPTGATVFLDKGCTFGPSVQIVVRGFNWPNSEPILLFWNNQIQATIPAGHGGSFQQTWIINNVNNGTQVVKAQSTSSTSTANLLLPCPNVTATPTPVPPTKTPSPADLIVVGSPILGSPPPIIGYKPVSYTVQISNTGDIDVSNLFFIDLYFDPPPAQVKTTGIDTGYSSGYTALSGLKAKSSRVITITSYSGFAGSSTAPRTVYAMVDSVLQIQEDNEENNVSAMATVMVTPGATPTPTATPASGGGSEISGLVRTLVSRWVPQGRASVFLVKVQTSGPTETQVARTASDLRNGFYQFPAAPPVSGGDYYKVIGCFLIDGEWRVGRLSPIVPPNYFANIYLLPDSTGCPYN